jgi:hypothetical protein
MWIGWRISDPKQIVDFKARMASGIKPLLTSWREFLDIGIKIESRQ